MEKDTKMRQNYIPPQMQMQVFIMEKGFATSINADTDKNRNTGSGDASQQQHQTGDQWSFNNTFSYE